MKESLFSISLCKIESIDENILENKKFLPDTFLQSEFWTSFKEAHGWKAFKFQATVDDIILEFTVLVRSFKKIFSIAYCALAPNLSFLSAQAPNEDIFCKNVSQFLQELSFKLKGFLPKNTLFVRFDPPILSEGVENFPPKLPKPCKKSSADIQPPDSVILNLEPTEEELLANMKPKWRYNIKLAEKKGVVVNVCKDEALERFYNLYKATSERDGIALHAKSYYEDLLLRASKKADVRLYLATHEETDLAGIITLFINGEAVYLYGASSNEKRNLMPAYALQWHAIQDAKKAGCKRYDFYGIPPRDDESHPMYGLYRFKTGFGGTVIHRVGSWDIPLKPVLYFCFNLLEKLRVFWFKRVKKLFVSKKK